MLEALVNSENDNNACNNRYIKVYQADDNTSICNSSTKEEDNPIKGPYDVSGSGSYSGRKYVYFDKGNIYGLSSSGINIAIKTPGYTLSSYSENELDISDDYSIIPEDVDFSFSGKVFKISATDDGTFLNNVSVRLKKTTNETSPTGSDNESMIDIKLYENLFTKLSGSESGYHTVTSNSGKTVEIPNGKYEYTVLYRNNKVVKTGIIEIDEWNIEDPKASFELFESDSGHGIRIYSTYNHFIENVESLDFRYQDSGSGLYINLPATSGKTISDYIPQGKNYIELSDEFFESADNGFYSLWISTNYSVVESNCNYSSIWASSNAYKYIVDFSNEISFPNCNTNVTKGTTLGDYVDKYLPECWKPRYTDALNEYTIINNSINLDIAFNAYEQSESGNPPYIIKNPEEGNQLHLEENDDGYVYFVGTLYLSVGDVYSSVADDAETVLLSSSGAYLKGTNKEIEKGNFYSVFESVIDYLNKDSSATIRLKEDVTLEAVKKGNIIQNKNVLIYHDFSEYDHSNSKVVDGLTIDLNSHTLTLDDGIQFLLNSENNQNVITIKNGTIVGNNDALIKLTASSNIVILENVKLQNKSQNLNSTVIYVNSGSLITNENVNLIADNGYGIYGEKVLNYNSWDQKYSYDSYDISGTININSANDCIHIDDDELDNRVSEVHLCGLSIGGEDVSNLISTNGYALYIDNKSTTDESIDLYNINAKSKKGIYVGDTTVQIGGSKLDSRDGTDAPAITVDTKLQKNIVLYESCVYTNTSVIKDISGLSNSSFGFGVMDNAIHQTTNTNPYDMSYDKIEYISAIYNQNVNQYLSNQLISVYIYKDVFRNNYDPSEIFDFGNNDYMYFIHIPFDEDSNNTKKVTDKDSFMNALNDLSVSEIYFDPSYEGNKTIDFEGETLNIELNKDRNLYINLYGVNLKNVSFSVSGTSDNNYCGITGYTDSGSGSTISSSSGSTFITLNNANLDLIGVNVENSNSYFVESVGSNWVNIGEGCVINSKSGIHFIETPSESNGGINLSENTILNVEDEAIICDEDSTVYIAVNKGSKINSNNDAIVMKPQSNKGTTSYIDISGDISASGKALSLIKTDTYVKIASGNISGENAVYIKSSLFHQTGVEITSGKLTSTADTFKQEGLFTATVCTDNSYIYIKGGKFKCGDDANIFNCQNTRKIKVYGGQFSKDLGNKFTYTKQNIDKTKTYNYKTVQVSASGTYKYAMARALLETAEGYKIMDAVSIDKDVVVDASKLSTVADGSNSGTTVLMNVNDEDEVEITSSISGQEIVNTYDIGISKIDGSNFYNVTDTNGVYQKVSIALGDLDADSLNIYHKHENNEPVLINKVSASDAEDYLDGSKTYSDTAFYYIAEDETLEEDMIYICTKQFSTFAIAQNINYDAASCDTPERILNLTANGQAQNLIKAATNVKGGEVYYSLDGETFSKDIPTGIAAQEYTITYYVKGNATHSDSAKSKIRVTIKAAASSGGDSSSDTTTTLATKKTVDYTKPINSKPTVNSEKINITDLSAYKDVKETTPLVLNSESITSTETKVINDLKSLTRKSELPTYIKESKEGALKQALQKNLPLEVVPKIETIDKEQVKEDANKIEEFVAEKVESGKADVLAYLDLNVEIQSKGEKIANISETEDTIEFGVALTSDQVEVLKDKYVYVVYVHNDVTNYIEGKLDGNALRFDASKFSTYAIVYSDTKLVEEKAEEVVEETTEVVEETKDSHITLWLLGFAAIVIIAIIVVIIKKITKNHD